MEQPVADRLSRFYKDYARIVLAPDYFRLFILSGLKGLDFNTRHIENLRKRIFPRVVETLRRAYKMPSCGEVPATETEIELIWGVPSQNLIHAKSDILSHPRPESW
jgi:hypothetical protein